MHRLKLALLLIIFAASGTHADDASLKQRSVFCPTRLIDNAKANVERYAWAQDMQRGIVAAAEPWMEFSDDELWGWMFGNTITRSWMVWSNGYCPVCKEGVPMYNWRMDPLEHPWKTQCPHCDQLFPKNDFYKFYRSGLDEHGVFDPKQADRSLLFNLEHPDPDDPLHMFGVDDGEGYVEGDNRWRFIGTYLIYGHFKQAVLGGIKKLAAAYAATGDSAYAHKAGVMLDRVADLYPTFDFKTQAVCYERRLGSNGYVSIWHDACEETRELALAYDQVFEGLRGDQALVDFLGRKAKQFKLSAPKATFADIQRNIEGRILRDALANQHKIASNYPRTPIAVAIMKAALAWPDNRDEVLAIIDAFLTRSTAVDGVTGEKGLANYSAFGLQSIALFLAEWDRAIPGFLDDVFKRQPRLHDMYRFHIDTWCFTEYYPLSGDTGWFARKIDQYQGVRFQRPSADSGYSMRDASIAPSMFTFMWRLYSLTGDPAFVQALHIANDSTARDLPYDLFAADPGAVQRGVREVIAREGGVPKLASVNKQGWHLAILRSGDGPDSRAAWLDYDSGGGHSHSDGMNLGLFAKGLDLMPDFGYPPVQFGGWGSARSGWYKLSAAHNTVVVDGNSHAGAAGKTTLWADGEGLQCLRASGPGIIGGKQFERTIITIDLAQHDFYMLDVFRVIGGKDHAKFTHSHFGQITPHGLSLEPSEPYGHGTQMREFFVDSSPDPGWAIDWKIEDRYQLLSPGADIHLRYTDLTTGAQAYTAEGWVTVGGYDTTAQAWIPRVMTRRTTQEEPLASTFVSITEPYEGSSNIADISRLPLHDLDGAIYPDANVAVAIRAQDGTSDLLICADAENPLGLTPAIANEGAELVQRDWGLRLVGELCWVRKDPAGKITRIALGRGSSVVVGNVAVTLKEPAEFIEIAFTPSGPTVVSGDPELVRDIIIDN